MKGWLGAALLLGACTGPLTSVPPLSSEPSELIVSVAQDQLDALEIWLKREPAQIQDRLIVGQQTYLLIGSEQVRSHDALLKWARRLQASGLAQSVDLNAVPVPAGFVTTAAAPLPVPSALDGLFNDLSFNLGSGLEGWWRTETQVEAAWRYSIGTGVTAAYLDQGFAVGHPELARRMNLNGHNNQTGAHYAHNGGDITVPAGDHGTASLLVGFAERDNHLPSVGVAPNARFTPYVAENVWDASRALLLSSQEHPQVIGMNMALPLYSQWESAGEFQQYRLFKDIFARLAEQDIPVVVPAHNYGEPVTGGPREWVPVAWHTQFANLIGVGGVQINARHEVAAWFSPDLVTGINARGSNYGDGLIWAPATLLDIASAAPDNPLPASMNGTSAACPFVTGVVTLLRSRAPDLSAGQLRELLLATARRIPAAELLQRDAATVPMIQVEAALKAAIRLSGQQPEAFQARMLEGRLLRLDDGQRRFETAEGNWKVLPTLNDLVPAAGSRYDDKRLQVLGWTRIPPLADQELEILHIVKVLE